MLNINFLRQSRLIPCVVVFLIMPFLLATSFAQTSFDKEIDAWRQSRIAELKSDDGWLTLAGLFWLKEGINTLGSGKSNDIELPHSAPEKLGEITFNGGKVALSLVDKVPATVQGQPVSSLELRPDTDAHPTLVRLGSLSIALIKRGDRFGIRVKDSESKVRREFPGLTWFPASEGYRISATFEPYPAPKEVAIPNVLGDSYKMTSPGLLRFTINGVEQTLEPVMEDDKLFIIFRDLTTGRSTYGAGRFLYANAPANGKVILDFNKAYNPPCAFTPFATCPLPPKQNRLRVSIESGEKDYHHAIAGK